MNVIDISCTNSRTLLPGPASRYYNASGSAIEVEKLLEGLCELGADTTELEVYMNSLNTGVDYHGKFD